MDFDATLMLYNYFLHINCADLLKEEHFKLIITLAQVFVWQ